MAKSTSSKSVARTASVSRQTAETDITLTLAIDGRGTARIDTGGSLDGAAGAFNAALGGITAGHEIQNQPDAFSTMNEIDTSREKARPLGQGERLDSPGSRQPYRSPGLLCRGPVRDVTLGGSTGLGDSGASGSEQE